MHNTWKNMEVINLSQLSMVGSQVKWLGKQLPHLGYSKTTEHVSIH